MYGLLIQAALVVFIAAGAWLHGNNNGEIRTRGEYAVRDLQAASEASIAYAGIVERIRAKEAAWQKSFSGLSQEHQKDLAANDKALDIALAGSRLFDKFAASPQASGSCAGAVATNSVGTDARGTELSQPASVFLRSEASRADKTVLKLNLCIGLLELERQ